LFLALSLGGTLLSTQGTRLIEEWLPWFLAERLWYLAAMMPLLVVGGLAYLVHDRSFRRDFWRRLGRPQSIGPTWVLVILLFFPAKAILAVLLDVALGGEVGLPELVDLLVYDAFYIVPAFLEWLFIGPFSCLLCEPGWRGYALDGLQARYSALVASLIVGASRLVWLVFLSFGLYARRLDDLFNGPRQLLLWAIAVLLGSVLYTWVYNNTGRSILAVMVFHIVGKGVEYLNTLAYDVSYVEFRFELNQILLMAAAVVVVWVWGARTLTRARWSVGLFARPRGALDR
jgi:membrane protease YdiL (CAAX protease family)